MKVLLLGATGTFGSRVVPALLAHKHEVVLYVRSESKLKNLIPASILSEVTVVSGDATDSSAISDAIIKNKCDALVNSAGLAEMFPWKAPAAQEVINAVAEAAVDASKKIGYPLRCWFMGGLTVLDMPGMQSIMIKSYMPLYPEHQHTYETLSATSLKWSLLCPSNMLPASEKIEPLSAPRGNPLIASADVPPGWVDYPWIRSIPFLGPLSVVGLNASGYITKLDDCADFIAADFSKSNSEFIGHRVGVKETDKAKSE